MLGNHFCKCVIWEIWETAPSGLILILISQLPPRKLQSVSLIIKFCIDSIRTYSSRNTNTAMIEALRSVFLFFCFFDKTISAPFLLENLMMVLSFCSEGKRWQSSTFSQVIEILVAVSINSHSLGWFISSAWNPNNFNTLLSWRHFIFPKLSFQSDDLVLDNLINGFIDCQLWVHSLQCLVCLCYLVCQLCYIVIVFKEHDINFSLSTFFHSTAVWVRTIIEITQSC